MEKIHSAHTCATNTQEPINWGTPCAARFKGEQLHWINTHKSKSAALHIAVNYYLEQHPELMQGGDHE